MARKYFLRSVTKLKSKIMIIFAMLTYVFYIFAFFLGICSKPIGIDDGDKIMESIKILNDRDSEIKTIYTKECSKSLNEMLAAKEDEESSNKKVS